MARILIVYSTRAGTTAHVANLLSGHLRDAGFDVAVASASADPAPDADWFVVGSGILANSWNAEAIAWLQSHVDELAGRTALFNVCLTAADPAKIDEARALNDKAAAIVAPLANEAFAGRYQPKQVGFWHRVFLRALRQPAQDHLNPAAIEAWARDLAAVFSSQSKE